MLLGRKDVIHSVAGADRFSLENFLAGYNAFAELIEDVPEPEFSVAAEIDLAGADAADGHADVI